MRIFCKTGAWLLSSGGIEPASSDCNQTRNRCAILFPAPEGQLADIWSGPGGRGARWPLASSLLKIGESFFHENDLLFKLYLAM